MVDALRERGVRQVYGEYWTCNRLTFAAGEEIVCAVVDERLRPGFDRLAGVPAGGGAGGGAGVRRAGRFPARRPARPVTAGRAGPGDRGRLAALAAAALTRTAAG